MAALKKFLVLDVARETNYGGSVKARKVSLDSKLETAAIFWARGLAARVKAIIQRHPEADPDNIRLTLIALELTPEERLQRSLRRGRGFAAFKA